MRLFSRMAGALAAVALLSGCTAQAEPEEPSDTQDDPAGSEESSSAEEDEDGDAEDADDPWAVPDEITVDYAQRVIDELMRIEGDAYRIAEETPPEEYSGYAPVASLERLREVFKDGDLFVDEGSALADLISNDFGRMHRPIRNRVIEIEEVDEGDDGCLVANGEMDVTATTRRPELKSVTMSLHLEMDASSGSDYNPTQWIISGSTAVAMDYEPFEASEVCG